MNRPRESFSRAVRTVLAGVLCLSVLLPCCGAWGYTPESPEVKAMVEKGLAALTGDQRAPDNRLGAKCLRALCYLKYYKLIHKEEEGKNLPIVKDTVTQCAAARLGYVKIDNADGLSNYSMGIALMFLCEVDPVKNRQLIEQYVAELLKRQKKEGGWGYDTELTGDTSQTQYAVLGMWMAQKAARIQIPIEVQEACTAWLMRTQSRDGGWGYQGKDPGTFQRVDQSPVSLSLSAAGCSSLYIMADLLQVTDSASSQKERPGPFKYIETPDAAPTKGPRTKSLDPAMIRQYLATGDGWFRSHYNIQAGNWQHYYMYALERYESFKDLAAGKWTDEPKWYDDGVRLLKQTQKSDGGWDGQDTPPVATCFALLFLLRSTKRVIAEHRDLGSGVALGAIGLPSDVSNLQESGGKLINTDISGEVQQVLDLLAKGDDPQILRMIEESKELKLEGDVTKRQSQIEQLRRFVSAGEPSVRILAVRTLGRIRGLEHVPKLLYALTDPSMDVVIEADKALRFVSRKAGGVGLPENPTGQEIKAAQAAWKAWYLSVKPDAELLD